MPSPESQRNILVINKLYRKSKDLERGDRLEAYQRVSSLMTEVFACEKVYDYESALRLLENVPQKLRSMIALGSNVTVEEIKRRIEKQIDNYTAKRNRIQADFKRVEQLLEDLQFKAALDILKPIFNENDPRLMDLKMASERLIAKVEAERDEACRHVTSFISKAMAHEKAYDYESGLQVLNEVSEKLRHLVVKLNNEWKSVNDLKQRIEKEIEYYTKKRNRIQLEFGMAKEYLEDLDFESASKILKSIVIESEPRLIDLKTVSEELIAKVQAERDKAYQHVSSVLSQALVYEETYDYESAAGVLDEDLWYERYTFEYEAKSVYKAPHITNPNTQYRNLRIEGYKESINEAHSRMKSLIIEINRLNKSINFPVKQEGILTTIEEINKLLVLQPNRKDMIDLKSQLLERYDRLTIVRDETFDKAKRLFAEQNYDGCLDELDRIDVSVTNLEINELRKVADGHKWRLMTLNREIRERVMSKQLDGLLVEVNELLSLKSDDSHILALRDGLIERDSKNVELEKQYREMRERIQAHELDGLLVKVEKFLALQPEDMYVLKLRKQLLILKQAERMHLICNFDKSLQILKLIQPEFKSQFKDVIDKFANEGSTFKIYRTEAYCSYSVTSLQQIISAIDKGEFYLSQINKVGLVDEDFKEELNSSKKRRDAKLNAGKLELNAGESVKIKDGLIISNRARSAFVFIAVLVFLLLSIAGFFGVVVTVVNGGLLKPSEIVKSQSKLVESQDLAPKRLNSFEESKRQIKGGLLNPPEIVKSQSMLDKAQDLAPKRLNSFEESKRQIKALLTNASTSFEDIERFKSMIQDAEKLARLPEEKVEIDQFMTQLLTYQRDLQKYVDDKFIERFEPLKKEFEAKSDSLARLRNLLFNLTSLSKESKEVSPEKLGFIETIVDQLNRLILSKERMESEKRDLDKLAREFKEIKPLIEGLKVYSNLHPESANAAIFKQIIEVEAPLWYQLEEFAGLQQELNLIQKSQLSSKDALRLLDQWKKYNKSLNFHPVFKQEPNVIDFLKAYSKRDLGVVGSLNGRIQGEELFGHPLIQKAKYICTQEGKAYYTGNAPNLDTMFGEKVWSVRYYIDFDMTRTNFNFIGMGDLDLNKTFPPAFTNGLKVVSDPIIKRLMEFKGDSWDDAIGKLILDIQGEKHIDDVLKYRTMRILIEIAGQGSPILNDVFETQLNVLKQSAVKTDLKWVNPDDKETELARLTLKPIFDRLPDLVDSTKKLKLKLENQPKLTSGEIYECVGVARNVDEGGKWEALRSTKRIENDGDIFVLKTGAESGFKKVGSKTGEKIELNDSSLFSTDLREFRALWIMIPEAH